ncbi:glycosyltransferase [Candidatus Uhrbacteria bacterium]|nr:glycosyltransferase [Candidatus Uhrbacteria bacterium]
MPRILIDARAIADCTSGGINRVAKLWILDQVQKYSASDCHLLTTGIKPSPAVRNFCDKHNFNYLHIKIPNKLWTLFCHLNISSIILTAEKKLKGPVDLLLLPNIAYTGALFRPYHILVHDLSFIIDPNWFNFKRHLWHKFIQARRRIQNADQIHCVSTQTKSDCIKLLAIPESNCQVFHFDPQLSVINYPLSARPAWLPNSAIRFVLLLGGSDPRKNIKTALKAITQYNLHHPQHYLTPVVLGGRVAFRSDEVNIAHIQAPGFISDAELIWLYQNASALLYPSWYEGFGLPLHEAHQFNTTIIASTAGALSETAPKSTILCHPAKINEWLEALRITQSNAS